MTVRDRGNLVTPDCPTSFDVRDMPWALRADLDWVNAADSGGCLGPGGLTYQGGTLSTSTTYRAGRTTTGRFGTTTTRAQIGTGDPMPVDVARW